MSSKNGSRDAIIRRLYIGGKTMPEIGKRYGLTKQRIHQIVRRTSPTGTAAYAPLTACQWRQRGKSITFIARRFGLHPTIVLEMLKEQVNG